jgi:quercetin dioxygenase-like cupin family protein
MKRPKESPGESPLLGQGLRALNANVAFSMAVLLLIMCTVLVSFVGWDEDHTILAGGAGDLGRWLEAHPMPKDAQIYPVELTRTAYSSTSLVQIRTREPLHVHQKHDLTVTVLRGKGSLELDGISNRMHPGDCVLIPAGAKHAYINQGRRTTTVLVTFSPPYDGKDMKVEP